MPSISRENPEVIIIGAGLAGLTAAYELKKKGISYKILEASDHAGGRAQTVEMKHGAVVNTGANWLHSGKDNPLFPLVEEFGIEYDIDDPKGDKVVSYFNGQRYGAEFRERMKDITFRTATTAIGATLFRDVPATAMARRGSEKREAIRRYLPLWLGVDPDRPEESSYRELLTDKSDPGGLQLKGGVRTLIDRLVQEVGEENIIYNAIVSKIDEATFDKGSVVTASVNGEEQKFVAKRAIFTGSIGILKSNKIELPATTQNKLEPYLSGLTMGKFAKAVIEVDPAFFADKPQLKDMHIDLLDGEPPAMCHVNTNGQNTIALLVGGDAAETLEKTSPEQALDLIYEKLDVATNPSVIKSRDGSSEEVEGPLKGYKEHVKGIPLITKWMDNPLTLGSYSARKTGGKREKGIQDGTLLFAGEAFHETMSGTLAGAYESGLHAAQEVAKQLQPKRNQRVGRRF